MSIHLVGGGWSPEHAESVYGRFLRQCAARVGFGVPEVAVVVVHDGPHDEGRESLARYTTVLRELHDCTTVSILLAPGERLPDHWRRASGLLVGGGTTPQYAATLAVQSASIAAAVSAGLPYAGFSAGAAVAPARAVVGGWRLDGVPVVADEAGEDLEPLTVTHGLGLLDLAVDVHAAQWGTLSRLVAAVQRGFVPAGVAIDEDTVVVVEGGRAQVHGAGAAWEVRGAGSGCTVVRHVAGGTFAV